MKITILCAPSRYLYHYVFPFGDDFINGEMEVGESNSQIPYRLFFALNTRPLPRIGIVFGEIGRDKIVDSGNITLVNRLLNVTAG